jgi:hypothetical protein
MVPAPADSKAGAGKSKASRRRKGKGGRKPLPPSTSGSASAAAGARASVADDDEGDDDDDDDSNSGSAAVVNAECAVPGSILALLLGSGCPVGPSPSGNTALHFAAIAKDLPLVTAMLAGRAAGVSLVDLRAVNGAVRTPLLALLKAAKEGEGEPQNEEDDADGGDVLRLVKAMVAAGAQLEAKDADGNTALHIAGASAVVVCGRASCTCAHVSLASHTGRDACVCLLCRPGNRRQVPKASVQFSGVVWR